MAGPTVVELSTAQEFMAFLSPFDARWGNRPGRFIFRGQPDASYQLTPSICRRGEGSFADGSSVKTSADTISRQVDFEVNVLWEFLKGCDRSGLIVPGYSEDIMRLLSTERYLFQSAFNVWPRKEMHQIMAVAQHYGVPTRLLDWTERSFVACYFAGSMASYVVDSHPPQKIAVWALDTKRSESWETVKIIRTPGGTSRNQAAQSGLFTTHLIKEFAHELYQPEALEEVPEIYEDYPQALLKITLPVFEVPALLDSCKMLGVEASTLFPGHEGVARGVRDWARQAVGVKHSQSYIDDYIESQYQED